MLKNIFAKFFSFKGRLGRWQYFKYTLITYLVFGPLLYWSYLQILDGKQESIPALALALSLSFMIWTNISLQIRRFHDLEKSGAWVMLNFLIVPNGSVLSTVAAWGLSLWLLIFKGTDGPNKYGDDPLKKLDK